MNNVRLSSIAVSAFAVLTLGVAVTPIAQIGDIVTGAVYSQPTVDPLDEFDVLGDRGPRTGVQGPGFVERPFYGPAADGR